MVRSWEIIGDMTEMTLPFVFTIPHCSNRIPQRIRSVMALSDAEIWGSTDIGTKEIFYSLPVRSVLCSEWSRLVVDLNRSIHQRDPKGVIAQVDYHGRSIYHAGRTPDEMETERRLSEYYWPFHDRLKKTFDRPEIKGLFDCHSLIGIGPPEAPDQGERREDIVLGNNGDGNGDLNPASGKITCPPELLLFMKEAFERVGFSVSINHPYSGGFITTHYGQKWEDTGKIAVQIEINQDLYIEPGGMKLVPEKFDTVRAMILQSFQHISSRL
jgi:N-formylglutamate deformylase